jgi:hypothetical protein
MGKALILKSLLRSLNSISFMLIIFTFKLIQTIRILWFCHRSLSEPKAKSRIEGYYYVGNKKNSPKKPLYTGPRLCHKTVLKYVVSYVAEAEFGALFVNAKEGTVMHTELAEMVHNQDATVLKTDNTTADGIINNTVRQKCSKAMDMIFYWVKDRVEQEQFNVGWAKRQQWSKNLLANFKQIVTVYSQ